MDVMLILTLKGVDKYYGYIPEIGNYPYKYKLYSFANDEEIEWYLDEHFALPVNKVCNTLLGYGDVDYLDSDKCKKLILWLDENIKNESIDGVIKIYKKLLEYAKRAVELKTGIIIEM